MVDKPHREYEIRCPVHGFITLDDWEREIIDHPVFQRLRRVRQLAWTDMVYPGAMHTRFEHSLGVMHTATLLYDSIVERSRIVLNEELAYNDAGLQRDRKLVRLAALLHDVGHAPFSHASEELFPLRGEGPQRYQHEHYSAAIVRRFFKESIENHPLNGNFDFKAEDIAAFLEGSAHAKKAIFWRELIDGQIDADRMDYLLRDSLHAGVAYGRFDLQRLVRNVEVIRGKQEMHQEGEGQVAESMAQGPRVGVSEGGWHAAESLILARYFMFTQVYFHKTRVAYDYHLRQALKALLPNRQFPSPEEGNLDEYLKWDDWRVLGLLADGQGGEHGQRLVHRDHYREIYHTPEVPSTSDLDELARLERAMGEFVAAKEFAENKSWYYTGPTDIPVASETKEGRVDPLSTYSTVVKNLNQNRQALLFVRPEDVDQARKIKKEILGGMHE